MIAKPGARRIEECTATSAVCGVRARQEQIESDLVRACRNDPIILAEMLRGDIARLDTAPRNRVATDPRHEAGKAVNLMGDTLLGMVSRAGLEPATL